MLENPQDKDLLGEIVKEAERRNNKDLRAWAFCFEKNSWYKLCDLSRKHPIDFESLPLEFLKIHNPKRVARGFIPLELYPYVNYYCIFEKDTTLQDLLDNFPNIESLKIERSSLEGLQSRTIERIQGFDLKKPEVYHSFTREDLDKRILTSKIRSTLQGLFLRYCNGRSPWM